VCQDSKQKGHQKYNVKDLETEGKGPSQEEIKEVEENALQEDVDEIFRESEEREAISKLDQEIMSNSQKETHEGELQDISQLKEEMETLYEREKAQQETREKNQEIKQDLIEKTQNNSKKKERLNGKRFELIYNDKVLANYNPNQTIRQAKGDLSQQTKVKTKTKTKEKKKETSKQKSFKTTAKKMELARDYGNREETKENGESQSTQTEDEKYREETRELIQKAQQEVFRRAEKKEEIENRENQEESEVSKEDLKEINQKDSKDIKKEKDDSKKELYERYKKEMRRRAIYGRYETKGYREWEQNLGEQQEEDLNKTQEILNENKEMAEYHQKREISEKNQEQQKEQRETIRRFHEEWAKYLAKTIRESKDNEISEEIKEELIEVLSRYYELQNLVKKLKKQEISKTEAEKELEKLEETFSENGSIEIELFKNFRWFQGFYEKNRSESLLKQEEKKYLRYISKRLNELKNTEETKCLNWKELLKANLYQITMLGFKEKSQIINLIQKKELSNQDKKELITKLIRLKIEDLNKVFGKSFEAYAKNYVKWGTGWYEDPGLKRIVLNNYFKDKSLSNPLRKNARSSFSVPHSTEEQQKRLNLDIGIKESKNIEIYTTLQLINDLLKQLQNFKEDLAKAFPEKIKKYPHVSLSRLWKGKHQSDFISSIKLKYETEGVFEEINIEDLQLLKQKLINKYGEDRLIVCLKITEKYEECQISVLDMIDELAKELGRVVVNFPVSKKILSKLFGMKEKFISNAVEHRIKKSIKKDYNPNYKFSLEHLDTLSENLNNILGQKAKKCLQLIERYKRSNRDLKEYAHQKYRILKPHIFKELNEESGYWLGFFVADVYINVNTYKIQFGLSIKDKKHLEKFAEFVGLDKKYINEYITYLKYKGEIRKYKIAKLSFGCKSMVADLKDLGFFESRGEMNKRGLPNSILFHIKKANKLGGDWSKSKSGRIALTFLHGFFDGDGHHYGGLCGTVYSSSRAFLELLKRLYNINNEIRMKLHKSVPNDSKVIYVKEIHGEGMRASYYLTLGAELYKKMISSYNIGLDRKKPSPEREI